jgi:hypothetical protein
MIIRDLHVARVPLYPTKTDAPLIINANAVLTGTVAPQLFQAIAWRRQQVAHMLRAVQVEQFAPGCLLGSMAGGATLHCEKCVRLRDPRTTQL